MKSQQGFIVFAGAAWLAAAAMTGGFIAAVESGTENTTTAPSQSSLALAGAPTDPAIPEGSTARQVAYEGHLYSNGGHFGDKNSDVKVEYIDP